MSEMLLGNPTTVDGGGGSGERRVKFSGVEEGGDIDGDGQYRPADHPHPPPPQRRHRNMNGSNGGGGGQGEIDGILVAHSHRHYHASDPATTRVQRHRTLLCRIALCLVVLVLCRSFLVVDVSPPDSSMGGGGGGSGIAAATANARNSATSTSTSSTGAYGGMPWHNERTVSVEVLRETNFARCDVHTVLSEDGSSIVTDWIFLEEMPAVNVIVHTLEGKYVVFQQRKYAIPGMTLSPVGGFVNLRESPMTAAKREVLEELGLGSRRTLRSIRDEFKGNGERYDNGRSEREDDVDDVRKSTTLWADDVVRIIVDNANPPIYDEYGLLDGNARAVPEIDNDADWVYLGRYRTAANRGGGFLYSYLLKNAVPLMPGGGTVNYNGNVGDDEYQRILLLDEDDVVKALAGGKFKEVKWAASFALAMLHVRGGMPSCCGNGLWEPPDSSSR